MRTIFIFNSCLFLIIVKQGEQVQRTRRSVFQLGDMITWTTGRQSTDFNKYGHFCGFGGKGSVLDAIDWCCKKHDQCYGKLQEHECGTYLIKYDWGLYNNAIVCKDTPSRTETPTTEKKGSTPPCKRMSCECDKSLAYCLGTFHVYYNPRNAPNRFYRMFNKIANIVTGNRF